MLKQFAASYIIGQDADGFPQASHGSCDSDTVIRDAPRLFASLFFLCVFPRKVGAFSNPNQYVPLSNDSAHAIDLTRLDKVCALACCVDLDSEALAFKLKLKTQIGRQSNTV